MAMASGTSAGLVPAAGQPQHAAPESEVHRRLPEARGSSSSGESATLTQGPLRRERRHQAAKRSVDALAERVDPHDTNISDVDNRVGGLEQYFDGGVVLTVRELVRTEVYALLQTMASFVANTPTQDTNDATCPPPGLVPEPPACAKLFCNLADDDAAT